MCTNVLETTSTSKSAREVTIVVLIILAGITLNAVIGEDGIILQAKNTKNLVTNETTYDNAQLAQLQNELKDNGLYSGIGIIPGTDTGGGSEGGENGTHTNQGGQTNQGGTNTNNPGTLVNTGNNQQTGPIIGGDAQDPIIRVLDGEQVAASFYRSDVTLQIYTQDKTQRIKYILTTTVPEINNELYPSGLVRELDIENGGTLTFTKNGEYTITAYAYDVYGQKSNPVVMWFKRETDTRPDSGITLTASGNVGDNDWYTSNVTIRVLGTDAGSARVTYRVQGYVYEKGTIGNYAQTYEYEVGEITPREIEIANGTTIKVATDGNFTITAYTYDEIGNRISTSAPLTIKRDATRPVIQSFTGEQVIQNNVGQGFRVSIDALDRASGLTSTPYTYQYKLAPSTAYDTPTATRETSKLYANLDMTKTYDMYVIVKDEAGNRVSSDVISRPAFWISSNPNQNEGERINEGREGSLQYTRSPNIEFSFKGQDSNNVDISKIEYQVEGTATEDGTIDGTSYIKDQPVNQTKEYFSSNGQDKVKQTLNLATDGDWTVKVHTYNKEGRKVTTNAIRLCRDTVAPVVTDFVVTENKMGTTLSVKVTNNEFGVSGQRSNGGYTYSIEGTANTPVTINTFTYQDITTSGNKALKVQTKDKAGNINEKTITEEVWFLVDKVQVGDYVAYDAGIWTETKATPTTNATFGGYTVGTNKATGLNGTPSGWRVLSKTGSGAAGTVKLITDGCPAMGFFSYNGSNFDNIVSSWKSFIDIFVAEGTDGETSPLEYQDVTVLRNANMLYCGVDYWVASTVAIPNQPSSMAYGYCWWRHGDSGDYAFIGELGWYGRDETRYTLNLLRAVGGNENSTSSVVFNKGEAIVGPYYWKITNSRSGGSTLLSSSGKEWCYQWVPAKQEGDRDRALGIRPVISLKMMRTGLMANTEWLGKSNNWKCE